ncbi:MAG: hypothetical protein PHF46_02760 [Candidatus Gracilibacteria bacterium]|nr:hypothetical protein [Candidatus Gracilibacteria bacterium]
MKKIYRINTISRFETEKYLYSESNKGVIDIGVLFWNKIFDKKYILSIFKNINFKDKQYSFGDDKYFENDFSFVLRNISRAKKILTEDFGKKIIVEDIVFAYRIINTLLSYFSTIFYDFIFSFSNGVYHKNYFTIEDYIEYFKEERTDFIKDFIEDVLKKKNIKNSIVIIEPYRPRELFQALIIASYLRKNGNIVIFDCSSSNEQFNFSFWLKDLKKNAKFIFSYFDFVILFQDYGNALEGIISNFKKGVDIRNISKIYENICYTKNDKFIFKKPETISDERLFQSFGKYFLDKDKISKFGEELFITLRMLPFKCHWSACKFCAINSSNLYIYKNENKLIHQYIDKLIEYISKNNISYIVFLDEAIHPDVLLYFVDKIIEKKLQIVYRFRTRFDPKYTLDFCKKIYKSGARFCGIGLESFSGETNLRIGKTAKLLPLEDREFVMNNFLKAGVNLHLYAIMGLPGERKSDILKTYAFLKKYIKESDFFTCSPNIFYLMKGTEFYNNKEKYGITLENDDDFCLSYLDYFENNEERDIDFLFKLHYDIEKEQLIPWLSGKDIDVGDFRNFIDRSSLFYHLKTFYKKSPYKALGEFYNNSKNDFSLDKKYRISPYLEVTFEDSKNIEIYDWVSFQKLIFNKKFKNFLLKFDNKFILSENIEKNIKDFSSEDVDIVYNLLKNKFLINQ